MDKKIICKIENPINGKPIFVYENNEMVSITISGTNRCLFIDLVNKKAFIGKPIRNH